MFNLLSYIAQLNGFLAEMGNGKNMYSSLSQHGQFFTVNPEYEVKKKTPKECFSNSLLLAMEARLIYCEGLVMLEMGVPIHHAWCCTANGTVVEPTMTTYGVEYFGIPFKTSYARAAALKSKYYGVLDNYRYREFYNHEKELFKFEKLYFSEST